MLTVKETPKEPCCEKCGQSLPTPPPLTTSGKIDAAEALLKEWPSGADDAFAKAVIEILRELEKRPYINTVLTSVPPIQTWPPYAPNTVPIPQFHEPRPYTGDPVYPTYPTVTCQSGQNTAAKSPTPFAVNSTSQADGFGGE